MRVEESQSVFLASGFPHHTMPDVEHPRLWRNIKFSVRGFAKLMYVVGYLRSQIDAVEDEGSAKEQPPAAPVVMFSAFSGRQPRTAFVRRPRKIKRPEASRSSQAKRLLLELESHFRWLNEYGGLINQNRPFGDKRDYGQISAWQVRVNDDGPWGGFAVIWYRFVTPETMQQWAGSRKSETEIDQVASENKCDVGLKSWTSAANVPGSHIHYVRQLDGGLTFHYDQDLLTGHWSIHT